MRMEGLARLHAGMQATGLNRIKFRLHHNHLVFSSLFLTDVAPYELALACLGHDFVLVFDVSRDYEVSAYLGDKYGALAAALVTGAGAETGCSQVSSCVKSTQHCRASLAQGIDQHMPTWCRSIVTWRKPIKCISATGETTPCVSSVCPKLI